MEWVSGTVYIRPNKKTKGDKVEGHTHNFDHTTIFFVGSFKVTAKFPSGETREHIFTAPSHCLIKAEVEHEIEFLEDGEFWCVYSHRNPQGEVVQEFDGWGEGKSYV